MTERELSFQQRDPAASFSVRPVTLVMSAAMTLISIIATVTSWPVETSHVAAYLAIAVTALSAAAMSYWSNPMRAPFRTVWAFLVLVLAMSAVILSPIATWNSSWLVVHQWAPITAGLTIAQLAPYRPARELLSVTILGAISVAFITILHPAISAAGSSPLVAIVNSSLPLVALGLGGTAYARSHGRSQPTWYLRAASQDRMASPAMRERVVSSVRHEQVSILNNSVVPFFTELLERGNITGSDRDRARLISANVRATMIAEVGRSWLDAVMDHLADERGNENVPGSEAIQDHERLAAQMSTEQRIVTRALVLALFDHPGFDPDGFGILITNAGATAVVTVTAKLDADESITRSGLGPYFAVVRIAFGDLHVGFQSPALTLKFSYDHK